MTETAQSQSIMTRYTDAYLAARATVGYGSVMQVIGLLIGVTIVFFSILMAFSDEKGMLQLGIIGIAFGCFMGALTYFFGVLISAQGQMLKATLDSAINSSPFLTNRQSAVVMSLPSFLEEDRSRGFTLDVNGDEVVASFAYSLEYELNIVVEASKNVIEAAYKNEVTGSPSYVQWSHQGRTVKAIKLDGTNHDFVCVVQVGAGSGKVQSIAISRVSKGSLA